jgi:hypothetical protein
MIHFHHQTTFHILPSLAILTNSGTKEILLFPSFGFLHDVQSEFTDDVSELNCGSPLLATSDDGTHSEF